MYGTFSRSRSLLWAAAAPVTAGLTAAALALDTCTPSHTAYLGVAASLRRYTSPIDLDTAFNGMLLGRGDPKTRRGKVSPQLQTCKIDEGVALGHVQYVSPAERFTYTCSEATSNDFCRSSASPTGR